VELRVQKPLPLWFSLLWNHFYLNKFFPGLAVSWRFTWGKKRGPHSRQIRVFLTTGFFPCLVFLLDLTSPESVNRGSCRVLHKEHSLLLPQPIECSSHECRLLSTNTACLSDSLWRPLPVSPQTPNGSGRHPTSHLPMPSVTVVDVVGLALGGYPEPQLRVLASVAPRVQP